MIRHCLDDGSDEREMPMLQLGGCRGGGVLAKRGLGVEHLIYPLVEVCFDLTNIYFFAPRSNIFTATDIIELLYLSTNHVLPDGQRIAQSFSSAINVLWI